MPLLKTIKVCCCNKGCQVLEKFGGRFLSALAKKKHNWPFYKIWPVFWLLLHCFNVVLL